MQAMKVIESGMLQAEWCFYEFSILSGMAENKILPISSLLMKNNFGKQFNFELLIFWRLRAIKSPFFKKMNIV